MTRHQLYMAPMGLMFFVLMACRQPPDVTVGLAPSASSVQPLFAPSSASASPSDKRTLLAALPNPPRTLSFAWCPPEGPPSAYEMSQVEDQHTVTFSAGIVRGKSYPVLVALHGQPRRGEAPRRYAFRKQVTDIVMSLTEQEVIAPLVLAMPVFRYESTNWPGFDLAAWRKKIDEILAAEGITARAYYVVGHSGAAGCGGDGLNRAHRLAPAAVGFFDTCLGADWQREMAMLRRTQIRTLLVHSVETAGFLPRQAHEYLPTFDFGRAYAPVGLAPSLCSEHRPAAPLREQAFRCASDAGGIVQGFVIDTGEGQPAHTAVVPIALAYFLREFLAEKQYLRGVWLTIDKESRLILFNRKRQAATKARTAAVNHSDRPRDTT